MKIKIKRYSQNTTLVLCLFLCPYLLSFLLEFLALPTAIKYVFDFIWIFLLFTMICKKTESSYLSSKYLQMIVLTFFGYTVLNYLVHFQSPFYYLWGFRNTFRGLVLFFSVIYYLRKEDALDCLKLMDKLFYMNAIIAFIQFFVLGFKQDNLGGIFGVQRGCNGSLNLYLCIMLVIYYVSYVYSKISITNLCMNLLIMLLIAAMGELKFFYIEFILILIVSNLVTKFSFRKLFVIVAVMITLIMGYRFFVTIFPDTVISLEYLIEYIQSDVGYASVDEIGRGTVFSYVNNRFLRSGYDRMLGLGMGNCDYATGYNLVTSSFYHQYGFTRYDWLSISLLYLEQGYLGLVLYLSFFICVVICARKRKTNSKELSDISVILCFVFVMMLFYNNSIKVESAYLIFFVLALPWTARRGCE